MSGWETECRFSVFGGGTGRNVGDSVTFCFLLFFLHFFWNHVYDYVSGGTQNILAILFVLCICFMSKGWILFENVKLKIYTITMIYTIRICKAMSLIPVVEKWTTVHFAIAHAALLSLSHPTFKPVRVVLIEISQLDNWMERGGQRPSVHISNDDPAVRWLTSGGMLICRQKNTSSSIFTMKTLMRGEFNGSFYGHGSLITVLQFRLRCALCALSLEVALRKNKWAK